MPTLKEILTDKVTRLQTVPEAMVTAAITAQEVAFRESLILLDALDRDKLGNILLTEKNLAQVQVIAEQVKALLFGQAYQDALIVFASEFNTQAILNNQYFTQLLKGNFEVKSLYSSILRSSQRTGINLLGLESFDSNIIDPLKSLLNANITSGEKFTAMIQNVDNFMTGTKNIDPEGFEGQLQRHTKQIAHDAFTVSDRQYTQTISEDLGLDNFFYAGGTITDTRVFCLERVGKTFTREEVSDWGNISQWQGRNRNTNPNTIFSLLGGYNCKHSIMPVV